MKIIRNVVKIEYAPAVTLGALRVFDLEKVKFTNNSTQFAEICIKNPAKCLVEAKMEKGELVFTSDLTFESAENIPNERLVFRFTTADGTKCLMGLREKPFPQIAWKDNFPGQMTQSSLRSYKVTWTASYPVLYIK